MKPASFSKTRRGAAFTLIELLVVIAIIGILAALLFPVTRAIQNARTRRVAQAELEQLKTSIENYKSKLGFYPPDNNKQLLNPLFYELAGTVSSGGGNGAFATFTPLDGIGVPVVAKDKFNLAGFANSSTSASGTDDKPAPMDFLKNLKPNQIATDSPDTKSAITYLVCSVGWTGPKNLSPLATSPTLAPWHYLSTHAKHNPGSYDLWVDLYVNGKIYRFSNWSAQPEIVQTP
jgi:prepilin-type N-terminal cleavage/methylation domain-containing protein